MKLLTLTILLFSFDACVAQKQAPPVLRFEHLTEKEGLSNNSITCIYKDRDGYMWFGTADGLNRYDGTAFKKYRHNNGDSTSIAGNEIKSIAGDPAGGLWIDAQCRGLTHLNTYSGKGITLKEGRGNNSLLQTSCDVQFCSDGAGNTWVKNFENLSRYDPATKKFTVVYSDKSADGLIYQILVAGNTIWLGEHRRFLSFDISSSTIKDYSTQVSGAACRPMLATGEGNIFIGSYGNGLFVFNPASGRVNHLFNGLIVNAAAEVMLSGKKQIWICTDHGLLAIDSNIDPLSAAESSFASYINEASNPYSLSSNSITGILQDVNGMIWLGTAQGIDKLNPAYLIFEKKQFTNAGSNTVNRYDANDLYISKNEAGAARFWFSYWHNGGLIETDSQLNVLHQIFFKHPVDKNEHANVSNSFASRNGNLWISTWDGLWEYDPRQEKLLRNFKFNSCDSTAPKYSLIDYAAEDDGGNVWAGTYNQSLRVLDPATGLWKIYGEGPGKLQSRNNRTDYLFFDSRRRMWSGDISFYDAAKKEFTKPRLEGEASAIIEDKKNGVWLATENGVARYNESKQNFTMFGPSEGLAGAEAKALLADADNNIWVSTGNGLGFIDTKTNTIRNFTVSDGLPENRLGNILRLLPGGTILLNFESRESPGFVCFDPKRLLGQQQDIPFHFTFFNIAGKPVELQQSPDSTVSLDLNYRDNMVGIGFSALAFTDHINLRYRYRLEEDQPWIDLGRENSITLTGLRSGHFNLCIEATDNNGRWMQKKLQLRITVHPPFWRTWWFIALLLLIAACTVAYFVLRRIRNIRAAAAIKQQMTGLELKALKAQMNPHFIFNSLTSIQESIVHGKTEAASKYLGKFSKLIRTILENSDKRYITLEQETDYLRLYLELESFRFDDLEFNIDTVEITDAAFIRIPPMLVQPFAENAIKHGLSHKKGTKKLTICFAEKATDILRVTIEDNGIGRERSATINRDRMSPHRSMGMKITTERLQLQDENAPEINVADLYDENGNSAGTRVTIFISTEK